MGLRDWGEVQARIGKILPPIGGVEIVESYSRNRLWSVVVSHEFSAENGGRICLNFSSDSEASNGSRAEGVVMVYSLNYVDSPEKSILREYRHGFYSIKDGDEAYGQWSFSTPSSSEQLHQIDGWSMDWEEVQEIPIHEARMLFLSDCSLLLSNEEGFSPPAPS